MSMSESHLNEANPCPYDLLTEFEDWFEWHRLVHVDKFTREQASINMTATKSGWVLVKPGKYGMWRLPNGEYIKMNHVTIRASG